MGMILIDVRGSFPETGIHRETALEGGHAAAIGRAIAHLTTMLPAAVARDHSLHSEGIYPPNAAWGKTNGDIKAPGPLNYGRGPNSVDPADRQESPAPSRE